MADYITIEQAREFLRPDDGTQEDDLQSCVNAATKACIGHMNRDVSVITKTEVRAGLGGPALALTNYPITAVTAVSVAGVAVDIANIVFGTEPSNNNMLYRKTGVFPQGIQNVSITYTAGLASIPADIQQAVLYTAKAMWDARRTDMNTSSEAYAGILSAGFWPDGPGAVPPSAKALLRNHRAVFAI